MKVLDYGAERKWQGLSALSVPLLPKPRLEWAGRLRPASRPAPTALLMPIPRYCPGGQAE
nr:hypothetical protein [uncultured bacterium]BDD36835.1 hypothetical protein [uncultured bacterium]BDD36927.1 hypothetical protein [uncultured bacterium]BDD37019.1 hypothetical protein [uncultured bacterium]